MASPYSHLRSKERTARRLADQAGIGALRTSRVEHHDGEYVLIYACAKGRVLFTHGWMARDEVTNRRR